MEFFERKPRPQDSVEEGKENKVFDEQERHAIYNFCKELTVYLRENEVKNIVFVDRASRPAWIGVDEYWNQNYKDAKKPGFYFMNPDGLEMQSSELIKDPERIADLFADIMLSGEFVPRPLKKPEVVESRVNEVYPKLVEDKKSPLVVFDTCSHTGDTIRKVTEALNYMGFSDVRVITADRPDWDSGVEPAAVIDHNVHMVSCYPFGVLSMVSKTDDVMTRRSNVPERKLYGNMVRSEIREIMQTEQKSDPDVRASSTE